MDITVDQLLEILPPGKWRKPVRQDVEIYLVTVNLKGTLDHGFAHHCLAYSCRKILSDDVDMEIYPGVLKQSYEQDARHQLAEYLCPILRDDLLWHPKRSVILFEGEEPISALKKAEIESENSAWRLRSKREDRYVFFLKSKDIKLHDGEKWIRL